MFRPAAYWAAFILTGLFAVATVAAFVDAAIDIWAHLEAPRLLPRGELLPAAVLLVTGISTFVAVFFGWRLDRLEGQALQNEVHRLQFRVQELEFEVKAMQPAEEASDGERFKATV